MYEIGAFAVYGAHEPEPVGRLAIRLLPLVHEAAHPWWDGSTRAILEVLPELVASGMRVLDFGCGASAILSLAVAAIGATPYPVEIHPDYAALAQQQLLANGQSMAVLRERLPDTAYDVVLANIGDAMLVGELSLLAPHGLGTDGYGKVIRW